MATWKALKKSAKKVITIDPEDIPEGTCKIFTSENTKEKFSVCKENGKIKIFPIEGEEGKISG